MTSVNDLALYSMLATELLATIAYSIYVIHMEALLYAIMWFYQKMCCLKILKKYNAIYISVSQQFM